MGATISRLPSAAETPVLQAADERLAEMARLIEQRAKRKGHECTFDEALAAVRAARAITARERGLEK